MYNPDKPYNEQIAKIIRKTWDHNKFCEIEDGMYPIVRKRVWYNMTSDVDHTDGVGTKGYYLWKENNWTGLARDAFAMNLNDLAMVLAVPYKIQNHLILPEEKPVAIIAVLEQLAELCSDYDIVMTGGETSIQNTLNGADLSITMSGMVGLFNSEYDYELPPENLCQPGDVLVGIASSGLHSNGFTKVREILGDELPSFALKGTKLYYKDVQEISKKATINGMMHITGGAYTKLKKILGKNDALIHNQHKLVPQRIFFELNHRGVSDEDMYKTFNCGIGFVLSMRPEEAAGLFDSSDEFDIIGRVVEGNGQVAIQSFFADREVVF